MQLTSKDQRWGQSHGTEPLILRSLMLTLDSWHQNRIALLNEYSVGIGELSVGIEKNTASVRKQYAITDPLSSLILNHSLPLL